MNYSPTPWIANENGHDVIDADGMLVVQAYVSFCDREPLAKSNIERIIACVNACKDIETKYLNEFPNWTLAVAHMARPGDVANLILKLGAYREALEKITKLIGPGPGLPIFDDINEVVREALK